METIPRCSAHRQGTIYTILTNYTTRSQHRKKCDGTKKRIPGHKGCNDVDSGVGWLFGEKIQRPKEQPLSSGNTIFINF